MPSWVRLMAATLSGPVGDGSLRASGQPLPQGTGALFEAVGTPVGAFAAAPTGCSVPSVPTTSTGPVAPPVVPSRAQRAVATPSPATDATAISGLGELEVLPSVLLALRIPVGPAPPTPPQPPSITAPVVTPSPTPPPFQPPGAAPPAGGDPLTGGGSLGMGGGGYFGGWGTTVDPLLGPDIPGAHAENGTPQWWTQVAWTPSPCGPVINPTAEVQSPVVCSQGINQASVTK